jgi:FtsP/CotA-like multicopper oxidase with cupredoxin domain
MRTVSMPIEGGARSPVARPNAIWRLNGQSVKEHDHQHGHGHHESLFVIERGETIRINLENQTAWLHPMHFHGVVFQEIDEQAKAFRGPLRDTLLLRPGEKTSIALRGDEPGRWMIHCHVLEHQNSGLMGVFEVKA